MSAWIVSKEHMDVVVTAIGEHCSNMFPGKTADQIGQALWAMNYQAVNCRYGERSRTPKYEHTKAPASAPQQLKAMHSLRYQCSEGRVPETRLYKLLNKCIGEVADSWACGTEEYSAAEWSL